MFKRKLIAKEVELIENIISFVKDKHLYCEGHDYSHVMEVLRYAIEIANSIQEKVDPFILVCGALFHDIGRVNAISGNLHGLEGAAVTEEYLEATWVDEETSRKITRVVARHTPTSMIKPETVEEKIVFDADLLDRFGYVGILRGVLGKKGSIEEILGRTINKRAKEYDLLFFEKSRELGKKAHMETMTFINSLREKLVKRAKDIDEISLPR